MILHHKLEDVRRIAGELQGPNLDFKAEELINEILGVLFGRSYGEIKEALRGAEPPVRRDEGCSASPRVRSRRSSG